MSTEAVAASRPIIQRLQGIDWTLLSKLTAISLATLYGLGLIVANEYLDSIWASDFSLVRPRCILTGVWTLIVLTIGAFPVLFPYWFLQKSKGIKRIIGIPVGFAIGWLLSWGGLMLVGLLVNARWEDNFPRGWPSPPAVPKGIAQIVGVYAFVLCMSWVVASYRTFSPRTVAILTVAASALATWPLAQEIYPAIPAAMGGGQPASVVLVLNKDSAPVWAYICQLPLVDKDSHLPLFDKAIQTPPVDLLYASDQQIVIRLNVCSDFLGVGDPHAKGRIVALDRKSISAIEFGAP